MGISHKWKEAKTVPGRIEGSAFRRIVTSPLREVIFTFCPSLRFKTTDILRVHIKAFIFFDAVSVLLVWAALLK